MTTTAMVYPEVRAIEEARVLARLEALLDRMEIEIIPDDRRTVATFPLDEHSRYLVLVVPRPPSSMRSGLGIQWVADRIRPELERWIRAGEPDTWVPIFEGIHG